MKKVWLLTSGDGSDGDEWDVISIHGSEESAIKAKKEYEYDVNIEEWDVFDYRRKQNEKERCN